MLTDKTFVRLRAHPAVAFLVVAAAPALLAQSPATWEPFKQLQAGSQIRVTAVDGHKVQSGLQSATDDAIVPATSK